MSQFLFHKPTNFYNPVSESSSNISVTPRKRKHFPPPFQRPLFPNSILSFGSFFLSPPSSPKQPLKSCLRIHTRNRGAENRGRNLIRTPSRPFSRPSSAPAPSSPHYLSPQPQPPPPEPMSSVPGLNTTFDRRLNRAYMYCYDNGVHCLPAASDTRPVPETSKSVRWTEDVYDPEPSMGFVLFRDLLRQETKQERTEAARWRREVRLREGRWRARAYNKRDIKEKDKEEKDKELEGRRREVLKRWGLEPWVEKERNRWVGEETSEGEDWRDYRFGGKDAV